MKTKSTSQSAFLNLRVVIGLFVALAGVVLVLISFGTFAAPPASMAQGRPTFVQSVNPLLIPPGFDCAQIRALGIDKQENLRAGAIMIFCGEAQGGSASPASPVSQFVQSLLPSPLAFGTTDVDLITPLPESGTHIIQSETYSLANPDNPNQIVVTYNDSRGVFANPINVSGVSVSTDGGTTFTRLTPSPFANTVGDPVTLYNSPSGTWFATFLDLDCGTQGIGGYKSTTPWDPNSWTHFCVHNGFSDDRESGWADNNSSSPFFGHMYVSYNDFNVGEGALFVRVSTDNGVTWTPHRLTSGFLRDVQITGDLATGVVYLTAMNEMGGGLTNRSNIFYRSTDGGTTWTNTFHGAAFPGPGVTTCTSTYFACMFTDTGGYWRHMGWGEPGALNGVVHYVYASRNTSNGDAGNIFYIRSTDMGQTFSAPLQLNTDTTTRPQWQPNISVSSSGTVFAMWYDARESTNCVKGNPGVPCYRMWGRKSTDNGVTWLADMAFSDVVTPLPGQPDPGIIAEYAGDYDYASALTGLHISAWDDGRVPVSGQSQQDVFFDKEPAGTSGIPCGDLVSFQARCKHGASGDKLLAKLNLSDTSHSGEQVTITVDGNPNSVTINGNTATLNLPDEPLGQHTVELTDPAGCFAPVTTNCN